MTVTYCPVTIDTFPNPTLEPCSLALCVWQVASVVSGSATPWTVAH